MTGHWTYTIALEEDAMMALDAMLSRYQADRRNERVALGIQEDPLMNDDILIKIIRQRRWAQPPMID
jgi:hypothetical protein